MELGQSRPRPEAEAEAVRHPPNRGRQSEVRWVPGCTLPGYTLSRTRRLPVIAVPPVLAPMEGPPAMGGSSMDAPTRPLASSCRPCLGLVSDSSPTDL